MWEKFSRVVREVLIDFLRDYVSKNVSNCVKKVLSSINAMLKGV